MEITRFLLHSSMQNMTPNEGLWCEVDVLSNWYRRSETVTVQLTAKNARGVVKWTKSPSATVYHIPVYVPARKRVNIGLIDPMNSDLVVGDTVHIDCGRFHPVKTVIANPPAPD